MQWQGSIRILGVYSSNGSQNAFIYFSNALGVVGWRRILPNAADGVTSMVAIAVAAQISGAVCQMFITNAGEIVAIQTV